MGLRLQPEGQGKSEADVNIMLTDREADVNKKIKKTFCMPENTDFCPPLALASTLLQLNTDLTAKRKAENGGDKTYTDLEALREDFASGSLHPGDLKPAVARALNVLLEPLRMGLQEQDVLKKAQKSLEKYVKAKNDKV